MAEKLQNKKSLKQQTEQKPLTLEEEWAKLRKEIEDWKIEKERMLKEIEEHYKNNPGGGIYYRWFDDDCYHTEEMFRQRTLKLLKRQEREDYARIEEKLLKEKTESEKEKEKYPHLVKAR